MALYTVATPIGNLEDITLRALRILKEVDLILCEDTRVTRKLLAHYEIKTPCRAYHAHSTEREIANIVTMLTEGKNLALVTDAGTPLISDPGISLLDALAKEDASITVVPIPGPSAVITALQATYGPTHPFIFYGFVPHKKGRQTLLKEIANNEYTSIVYESTHRIMKLLAELETVLTTKHTVIIARELTKFHEEIIRGTPTELTTYFTTHPDHTKGEFVVCVQRS